MTTWNDLPFELKSLILKHDIHTILASALSEMRSRDWILNHKSDAIVQQVRRLIAAAPQMRHEIFRLTKQVKKELELVVQEAAKVQIARYAGRLAHLKFVEVDQDNQLGALNLLELQLRSVASVWEKSSRRGSCEIPGKVEEVERRSACAVSVPDLVS